MLPLSEPTTVSRRRSPRLLVLAALVSLLISGTMAAAADHDLKLCLDIATKLEAGGDVSDKDLSAAHQACQLAEQIPQSRDVGPKLDAASSTVNDESARRHPH